MIITTNLPLKEIKSETMLDKKRIYDRILEMCTPMYVGGASKREVIASMKMEKAKTLLNTNIGEECFRKIIEKRNPPKSEPMVDGKSGFLYFDKNKSICYSLHWEHYFQHIIQKYKSTDACHYTACMPAHLLHKYGKIRNESKSIAIFDGPLRDQRNVEYIYACKS